MENHFVPVRLLVKARRSNIIVSPDSCSALIGANLCFRNIVSESKQGKQLGDRNYKVHLDGYDQTSLLTGKGPSNRHEIVYFAEGTLGAVRTASSINPMAGSREVDWPVITNLRLDPFERLGMPTAAGGSLSYYDFFVHEFWRFVYVQKEVGEYAQTFIEFPPMQKGATFNMEAVKQQIEAAQKRFHSQ